MGAACVIQNIAKLCWAPARLFRAAPYIVDEFDQFVVVDEEDRGDVARYAEHWGRLACALPKKARYLVKSATLGVASQSEQKTPRQRRANKRAALIQAQLKPQPIHVLETQYAAVVPFKPIKLVEVSGDRLESILDGVSIARGKAHLRLDEVVRRSTHYRDVERRAPGFWSPSLFESAN